MKLGCWLVAAATLAALARAGFADEPPPLCAPMILRDPFTPNGSPHAEKPKAGGKEGPEDIRDNAFLVEEAYNQEPGVVQHILNWSNAWSGWRERLIALAALVSVAALLLFGVRLFLWQQACLAQSIAQMINIAWAQEFGSKFLGVKGRIQPMDDSHGTTGIFGMTELGVSRCENDPDPPLSGVVPVEPVMVARDDVAGRPREDQEEERRDERLEEEVAPADEDPGLRPDGVRDIRVEAAG